MRGLLLLAAGAIASVGAALAISVGVGAQTVDGLDLGAVRARAKLDPDAAAAFEQSVLHRGDRFRADADLLSAEVRANQARQGGAVRTTVGASGSFDFDAMVAAASQGAGPDDMPRLIAFASLSMPKASLRHMIADVTKAGGVVVFRGFPANSARRFTASLAHVLPEGRVRANVGIDPRLFRAFGVTAIPVYVVTATGFDLCDGFDCRTALPPHDRIAGNVTLDYALATIGGGKGPAAHVATVYATRLTGGVR
ncbi:type-F conjugative transfer system pilin assembly protein TrbC [Sphingomonas sp. ID1715]|uniref:type-F conjugative transfer system pilin assembly protein TrbC n=1 Tax=Sphingomonas sp. ID1715 TaxID=1656898 RepID=UPI001488FDA4|nr:type-F conjugative transfer system pilin assembly protein TrbC [Sphingomonas sp. ID1715]NNM77686.1 type-F conjugative transfer system pilin assembly protein TrbC [Sphingomonas sp. ID1715]